VLYQAEGGGSLDGPSSGGGTERHVYVFDVRLDSQQAPVAVGPPIRAMRLWPPTWADNTEARGSVLAQFVGKGKYSNPGR
jgi:hypothetical protein